MKYLISAVIFCFMVQTPCFSSQNLPRVSTDWHYNKSIQSYLMQSVMQSVTLLKKPQFESIEFVESKNTLLDKNFGPNRKDAPTLFSAYDIVEKTLSQIFYGTDLEKQKASIAKRLYNAGLSLLCVRSIHPITLPCLRVKNNKNNLVFHTDLVEAARAFFIIGSSDYFWKETDSKVRIAHYELQYVVGDYLDKIEQDLNEKFPIKSLF